MTSHEYARALPAAARRGDPRGPGRAGRRRRRSRRDGDRLPAQARRAGACRSEWSTCSGVVVVAMFWGLAFGLATAVLSAAAFSFFHLPPVGRFTLADGRDWIGLSAFVLVATAIGLMAELARARGSGGGSASPRGRSRRRDGAAAARGRRAAGCAARRLAAARGSRRRGLAPTIELGDFAADERSLALALRSEGARIGTLVLPATLSGAERARVRESRRALAGVDPRGGAASRRASGRGGGDGGVASQRRDEDGRAALGLSRPAHAGDGDPDGGRSARPADGRRRRTSARCASW